MKSYLSSQNGLDLNENSNKTKLLVDNTSFLPFLEVLEQKKNLKINFNSKHKKNNKSYISNNDYFKICQMMNSNKEDYIKFSNKNEINFKEDSLNEINEIINDSFDEFENEEKNNKFILSNSEIENNLISNENNINNSIMKFSSKKYFYQNYYCLLFYWKIFNFCIFFINFLFTFHILKNIYSKNVFYYDFYSLKIFIIIILIYFNNFNVFYNFYNKKIVKNVDEKLNFSLIFAFILLFFSNLTDKLFFSKEFLKLIETKTFYFQLKFFLEFFILINLLLTFKFKEYFNEYIELIPIKNNNLNDEEENFINNNNNNNNNYIEII